MEKRSLYPSQKNNFPPTLNAGVKYSNVRDEALRLNIGTRTLWRWIKAGRVPSYKLGRRVLLRPEEIDYALMNFRRASLFE